MVRWWCKNPVVDNPEEIMFVDIKYVEEKVRAKAALPASPPPQKAQAQAPWCHPLCPCCFRRPLLSCRCATPVISITRNKCVFSTGTRVIKRVDVVLKFSVFGIWQTRRDHVRRVLVRGPGEVGQFHSSDNFNLRSRFALFGQYIESVALRLDKSFPYFGKRVIEYNHLFDLYSSCFGPCPPFLGVG